MFFSRREADFGPGKAACFQKMQTIFSMGYRLYEGSYWIGYAEEMFWEAINSQEKFH